MKYKSSVTIMSLCKLVLICSLLIPVLTSGQPITNKSLATEPEKIEWILRDFVLLKFEGICISGNPKVSTCKYGEALTFNGSTDGIFLDRMPLSGLEQFTIEVIVRPESGGNFEQRFFHCGEIRGSRVLLETRSTKTNWYFDAFIKSGNQQKTLIDSTLIHPLDRWYHLVFVVDRGKLTTYVNGKKELENQIDSTYEWKNINRRETE